MVVNCHCHVVPKGVRGILNALNDYILVKHPVSIFVFVFSLNYHYNYFILNITIKGASFILSSHVASHQPLNMMTIDLIITPPYVIRPSSFQTTFVIRHHENVSWPTTWRSFARIGSFRQHFKVSNSQYGYNHAMVFN